MIAAKTSFDCMSNLPGQDPQPRVARIIAQHLRSQGSEEAAVASACGCPPYEHFLRRKPTYTPNDDKDDYDSVKQDSQRMVVVVHDIDGDSEHDNRPGQSTS
jgi:hypothetical protein